MELFGMRLKSLRQGKKLTQKQLAGKLGIVKASISGYEQSAIYPSIEVLIRICKLFDASADYLLGLSDVMEFKVSQLTDEQILIIMGTVNQFEQLNNICHAGK
jgi:transcriptional regulator with XRE-family HTH domain